MTGIVTVSLISWIFCGSAMRATPPCARMSAGTRSRAMTATAPASSAIRACSAVVTSMITPPLSISARPLFTRIVPISLIAAILRDSHGKGPGRAGRFDRRKAAGRAKSDERTAPRWRGPGPQARADASVAAEQGLETLGPKGSEIVALLLAGHQLAHQPAGHGRQGQAHHCVARRHHDVVERRRPP